MDRQEDRESSALREALPESNAIADFLRSEATGGVALVLAAAAALVWANASESYFSVWHAEVPISLGSLSTPGDLQHWINDGLMTLFFFVVALEIKREMVRGELSEKKTATLPVLAAVGGVIAPALIFLAIVGPGAEEARGWAIPMATDIAFAIGILALLGDRVPFGVRILLLSIAIVDDVIAIAVIAVFYSTDLSLLWLLAAVGAWLCMVLARRAGVIRILPFVPLGILIWFATLQSGIHATIAGVVIGLLTPARPVAGRDVLDEIEHALHPYTSALIVPLFALANAGVAFNSEVVSNALGGSLAIAIAGGLIVGKFVGISGTIALATRLGVGRLPQGLRFDHVLGIAALCGVGFTVSIFITQLSFSDMVIAETAKMGIFAGSAISAMLGIALLTASSRRRGRSAGGKPDD
jgi:NhaA family Na+:H+ antiporter